MNEKKKHYLIYQTTNLVNGKIYIGKHETTDIEDDYFGSGKLIRAAINKYGLENFVKTILFELQNEEEMNLLEKCVVTQEFCDREDTYNMAIGGDGGWSYANLTYDHDKRVNNGKRLCKQLKEHPEKRFTYKLKQMSNDDQMKYSLKLSISIKQAWKNKGHNWIGKHHSIKSRQQIRNTMTKNGITGKRTWLNKDGIVKYVSNSKVDEFIKNGWEYGRPGYKPRKGMRGKRII